MNYYDSIKNKEYTADTYSILQELTTWKDSLEDDIEDSIVRATLETVIDIVIDLSNKYE